MIKQNKIFVSFAPALFFLFFLSGCGGGGIWPVRDKEKFVEAKREVVAVAPEPSNIFLMLPMQGELAATAQAIHNGFLAAYEHAKTTHPQVKVKVIDTTGGDIPALYQQAITDGADVIVGPLTKKEVEIIQSLKSLPIPVLALNTLDDYHRNVTPNLYQFGLLPQDEAAQVAMKMAQNQEDRAAIIAPNSNWGNKIVKIFQDRYLESGGEVVDTLSYNATVNLAEKLCPFLAQDATKLCVPKKRRDKKQELSDEPLRRQDINSIFLVASAKDARQIVPLLKFYYAGDLPTYSISTIYPGKSVPTLDQDIDGVYFCDVPWVLQDPGFMSQDLQTIYRHILASWPDSFSNYPRLYALGVDAYNLAQDLPNFLRSPQYGFVGATGTLYLDSFNHIFRQLPFAKMHSGLPVIQ